MSAEHSAVQVLHCCMLKTGISVVVGNEPAEVEADLAMQEVADSQST